MPPSGGCLGCIWLRRGERSKPEWSAYLVKDCDDRLAADYDVETISSNEDAMNRVPANTGRLIKSYPNDIYRRMVLRKSELRKG